MYFHKISFIANLNIRQVDKHVVILHINIRFLDVSIFLLQVGVIRGKKLGTIIEYRPQLNFNVENATCMYFWSTCVIFIAKCNVHICITVTMQHIFKIGMQFFFMSTCHMYLLTCNLFLSINCMSTLKNHRMKDHL